MIISSARQRLLTAVAPAALLATAPAMAQQAQPGATQAVTPDEGVGAIIVTAQRRSENIQNVPVSVGVVSGEDFRAFTSAGDDTLLSLAGRVPSLYVESTTGRIFPRFYIRGLGNIDFYLGASQPVEIIQDDVVLEHVVLKSNPAFDVRQVEVLRGPQGTLFGRNTTAGIIKFDTYRPTQTFQGRADLSVGSRYSVDLDMGVGGPIVPGKVAARVSALIQHRAPWVDNAYTGASADSTAVGMTHVLGGFDDRNVRLQLQLTPSSAFTVDMSAHGRQYSGTSTLFHRAALKKGSNSVSAEPRDIVAFDEGQNNPQAYDTYGGSVRAAYDFGGATLTSITAYESTSGFSRGDTDGGAAALFPVNGVPNGFGQSQGQIRRLGQFTEELRLASPAGRKFTWQIGGIYFDNRDITDFYQRGFFLTTAARNPNNWVRLHDINTSYAGFAQASYAIVPSLTITAGVRVTNDTKSTELLKTADTAAGVVTYGGRRYVRLSDTQPSFDLSALYTLSPNASVYARAARGFRGPTIQGRSAVFNTDFTTASSEKITSYEAGFKSRLFNDTLQLNASAFTYNVTNIQLNGNDVNGNGVLFNADHAKAYGAEADAIWKPARNLTLSLGASVLRSKIRDKRVYAQVCALNGVVVCTVLDPTIQIGTNVYAQIDGDPLPNAPKYNINGSVRYDLPFADGSRAFIAADANVQGYTQFVLYRTREFYSDGNFEGGLKLGYALPGNTFEVAAFARNITNEKNLKGVIENYLAAVFNEPRIIGVSVSGRF